MLVAGTLTAFMIYQNTIDALRVSISTRQLETTKQTMDKLDRFLYERLIDIQQTANREQVQRFLREDSTDANLTAQITKQLDDLNILSGAWENTAILDNGGRVVLSTEETKSLDNVISQKEFKDSYAKAVAGQTVYSNVFLENKTDKPIMVFMTPIRDALAPGKPVIGVAAGQLAWRSAMEILQSLKGSSAELVNKDGFYIGGNEFNSENEILKHDHKDEPAFVAGQSQQSGFGSYPGLDDHNRQHLTSFTKEAGYLSYKGNGWTLFIQTPESVAYAPALQLAKTLGIIFTAALIISTIAFLLFLRVIILKPIVNLKEVVNRLSRGDFSLRTTIASKDEVGELGRGFNEMADKIQLAYQSLKERTLEAENEKRVLQTLFDNLPVGILIVKVPSGEPIMMNRAGKLISGRKAYPGTNYQQYTEIYDIIKEDGSPYPTEQLPLSITLATGKTVTKDDLILRRPDKSTVSIRSITAAIKDADGSFARAVSVFEDISEERKLERSREEFFSIASHELRTPLTAIRGNTEMIKSYFGEKLNDPDLKEMIDDIHVSSVRLIRIVNDFLDTSRLEQSRMKFVLNAFDIEEMAQEAVKQYQVTSSRKKVMLAVRPSDHPMPLVYADSDRTRQVLINLIGNALKFTEQGAVTISFHLEDNFVKLLVSDTGRGIAPDAQERLFRKFEQSGATVLTRDSVQGTGLGLYISKMIVEQMNGQVKLESSTPDKGTTFSFSLPIAKEQSATNTA